MLKVSIIILLSIFVIIDFAAICGPDVRKLLNNKKKKKEQKAFAEKMKKLGIKWMNLINTAMAEKCLTISFQEFWNEW